MCMIGIAFPDVGLLMKRSFVILHMTIDFFISLRFSQQCNTNSRTTLHSFPKNSAEKPLMQSNMKGCHIERDALLGITMFISLAHLSIR